VHLRADHTGISSEPNARIQCVCRLPLDLYDLIVHYRRKLSRLYNSLRLPCDEMHEARADSGCVVNPR